MTQFDRWTTYAAEIGIPEEEIDEAINAAEVCEYDDEGPCAENTKAILDRIAEQYPARAV